MAALGQHLPEIWLLLIGFLLLYYAVADGANLGVGILSLFARREEERGAMVATMEGTWHNAQTWLVLLGGMLFGAFPLFYGVILSALYLPLALMLLGLIFRGVALELRGHARNRDLWSVLFGMGSLLTALGQGASLGGLLGGTLEIRESRFVGGVWDWLSPYGLLVCAGVLFGYSMLGASYLILKTEGSVQRRAFRFAWAASLVTLLISVSVHSWTVTRYAGIARERGAASQGLVSVLFPFLAGIAYLLYLRSLKRKGERSPLLWNAAVVLFSFLGLSQEFYPQMIPHVVSSSVTVRAAAASPATLAFMLSVMAVVLPVILGYTVYAHWVFRGKSGVGGYGEE